MRWEVERGVAVLDAKVPGWWERIDVDRLDMAVGDACVLGQLFPDGDEESYFLGLRTLGIPGQAIGHGFNTNDTSEWGWDYAYLTQLWREAIEGKRVRGAVQEGPGKST